MKKFYFVFLILAVAFSLQGYATIIYVNQAATTGSNDGTSWANAYTSLQSALDVAVSDDQIWVAKGTYYPSSAHDLTVDGDRDFHFEMIEGVAIYGGFSGTETAVSQRTNFGYGETNETILSGDIGTAGITTDNCYHVFYNPYSLGLTSTAILDGFTITGGYADGTITHCLGGGMYNSGSSPTLTNIVFTSNKASNGGGIYNYSSSSPILTNVTFTSNTVSGIGGGMFNYSSSPILNNITFTSNTASNYGGGMYNQTSSSPVLNSITFTSNTATYGGGMCNKLSSSPTLNNVSFASNTASTSGGGMYNNSSSPTLTYVIFTSNTANSSGGGMYNTSSSGTLTNVTFTSNTAKSSGGGIYNNSSSLAFDSVTFTLNKANYGGGMSNNSSSGTLTNVTFTSNTASTNAGGLENSNSSSPILTNVTFTSNTAAYGGGGLYNISLSLPILNNVIFTSNTAGSGGGMFNSSSSSPTFNNVTITSNTASASGGGMYNYKSSPTLNNCIVWGNTASTSGSQFYITGDSITTLNYSCYSNSDGDLYTASDDYFVATNNNITDDPVFLDADNNDFRIKATSPCIDAGDNSYNTQDYDIRGQVRVQNTTIDMGAYEYNASIDYSVYYVNQAIASGNKDGSSWDNAYTSLQSALDDESIVSGDQIWVAKGTYYPSSDYEMSFGLHFEMIDGVAIYGGFAGTETTVDERTDFGYGETNETILSGNTDDCIHVIYNRSQRPTSSAILDGFTITGGNAGLYSGGGMSNISSSPTLSNLIFIENSAQLGGGMYNVSSSPILTNVTFISNSATMYGGGIYNISSSSPTLTNVTFTSNSAEYFGGGIYNDGSSPSFTNVMFTSNSADDRGGGIYNSSSSPTLTNVTLTLNTSEYGGGIYNNYSSSPTFNNCIVWGNTATNNGNQFYISSGTTTLNYSCYSNSDGDIYGTTYFTATNNNITDDPVFYDADNNDYRLYDVSPCVDNGDNSSNTSTTDVRGQLRIQNGTIDMGAYEYTDGVDPVCTGPTDGGEIAAAQQICSGNIPEAFTSTSLPTGHTGTLEYQWQSSTTSASDGFNDIDAANASTYTSEALTDTTWFKRLAKTSCMNWGDAIASNVIEVTVYENPSVPTITDGSNTYTYDGTVETATANVASGETIDWYDAETGGNAVSAPSGVNAGNYSAYAEARNITTGCTSSNRILVTLTITPLEIAVTADADQGKVYGDSDPELSYTVDPALIGDDTFTGSLTRTSGEDVGTYAITTGTLSAGSNYAITLADVNFTITAKTITVTADADQVKVYGDSDPELSYTVDPALIGDDTFTGSLTRTSGEDVGTYAIITGTLSAGSNYTIILANVNFAITTLPVTVKANADQSKVYGDSDPELSYTVDPALIGDDSFSGSLARTSGEDVGTYTINQGNLDAGTNYTLTFISNDFTITTKQITVIADADQSKVYGDDDPILSYTYTPELETGDAFSGNLLRESGEDVGTYAITTGTLSAGSNYTIILADVNFTITAKTITVTADADQSKKYSETDPTLTYTYIPELASGDAFSGKLSRAEGEDVGTYAITTGTLSAGSNYEITLADVNFTITAKTITVTADADQGKVYGDSDPELSYTVDPALIGDDTFTGSLTRISGEDVGTYAINQGSLDAGTNYTVTFVSNDFAITTKVIKVSPDANQSKVYGDSDPELSYTVDPALIGDDSFSGSLARTSGEDVGTYTINQGNLDAGTNYTLTFISNDFTITTKQITVIADADQSKMYGDDDPILRYTYTPELETGDAFSGNLLRESGEDVGTYAITTGTLSAGSNYTMTLADVNFTITKKTVYVFATTQTKVYGDSDPELTYTYLPELIEGNIFSGDLSREAGDDSGVYSIEIGSLSAGSNYTIDYTESSLFIYAKQLTISDPELTTSKQYDGNTMAEVTAGTLSGVLASDEGNVSVTAIANYDDESLGSEKTITVTYLLDGSAAINYLAPADYIVYTGVIFDQIIIDDLHALDAACEGGTLDLSYSLLSGTPTKYQILFDESAINAGFSDVSYTSLSSSDVESVSIDIPEGVAYGTYTAQLQLSNSFGTESDLYPFTFTINISSDLLVDKFDDIILCDNSSKQFVSYQWYKDDVLISGATKQYYCDPKGLSGTYYVQVVTIDGEELRTCAATYNNAVTEKAAIAVYPNPAQTGQTVTIKVIGAAEEDLEGAMLYVYNILGNEVYRTDQVETINYLSLSGQYQNYIIRIITANGKELNGKLTIVR